jgi:hypothetical protein
MPNVANKYLKNINGVSVDIYDILTSFEVHCPATAHAIKKLLMPGKRGDKSALQDLYEAKQAVERAIELEELKLASHTCARVPAQVCEYNFETALQTRHSNPIQPTYNTDVAKAV